jgi:hypothetical protein
MYPLVTIHRSDELAALVKQQRTLYVYRDGHATAK